MVRVILLFPKDPLGYKFPTAPGFMCLKNYLIIILNLHEKFRPESHYG